ncbi:hypothetical protein C7447_102249 [Tenacibaculum adriaticum]|uniref:Uncharacterized protein n=1 Tax=Tenacibaculum adriaticum TaxID=413713 RepID=A0A5S5DSR4_9FLAO|nr:hypothetical protein [Tenacibaculum adriaticum]TYP98931.1 hypothetical protein C7447_102249 [Tenacibaculum adriaticum]
MKLLKIGSIIFNLGSKVTKYTGVVKKVSDTLGSAIECLGLFVKDVENIWDIDIVEDSVLPKDKKNVKSQTDEQ